MSEQGLLTLLIAAIVAYIAHQQAQTAKRKVKLDLFDRRLKVHQAVHASISETLTKGLVGDTAISDLTYGTREAQWLFGPEISQYINGELLIMLTQLRAKQADHSINSEEGIRWLSGQYNRLALMFDKYLILKDIV